MAPIASSVPPWIPEDDLLLKNSVEESSGWINYFFILTFWAGASLEALAKGAVHFSRRFTVRELQDRWRSLLYDPEISTQASARMVEFELSSSHLAPKSNRFGNSKGSAEVPVKRKVDSIRRHYYAMRKRLRREAYNSTDLGFPNEVGFREHATINKEPAVGNCMVGNKISNDSGLKQRGNENMGPLQALPDTDLSRNDNLEAKTISAFDFMYDDLGNVCSGFGGTQRFNSPVSDDGAAFHSMGFLSPLRRDPLWKMTEDISAPQMPINMSLRDKGHGAEEASTLPDNNDCLLNLADEDDLLFMDVDANTLDKSCYDNLNSLLLNSPNNSHEDDVSNVTEPKMLVLGTCLATPGGVCPAEVDVIAGQLHIGHGIQDNICSSDVSVPSSSTVPNPCPPELPDGIMLCTLNTEDQEIPCNDDIFPPKAFPTSVLQLVVDKASEPASLSENQKNGARELCLTNKKENHARPFSVSLPGPNMLPETHSSQRLVGRGVQSEFPDDNCRVRGSKHGNNSHVESGQCRPAYAALNTTIIRTLEKVSTNGKLKELVAPATVGEHLLLHEEPEFSKMIYIQPASNPSTSDQEELHSDNDLPSYSDIEALIMNMDLCQHDEDSLFSKEVSSYQHKETKQKMVRLEQCARSSLRRAIASQGALAFLDGPHSRHYIKKPEVILGRATDDIDVDIDLAREGRANKISRRQASIKMERDGSFFLRNLGKSSISVNGKEVATRQLLRLDPSCLIEIRDISFVFEVNHKSVSRFLANTGQNSQENNAKFEWSPEGFYE